MGRESAAGESGTGTAAAVGEGERSISNSSGSGSGRVPRTVSASGEVSRSAGAGSAGAAGTPKSSASSGWGLMGWGRGGGGAGGSGGAGESSTPAGEAGGTGGAGGAVGAGGAQAAGATVGVVGVYERREERIAATPVAVVSGADGVVRLGNGLEGKKWVDMRGYGGGDSRAKEDRGGGDSVAQTSSVRSSAVPGVAQSQLGVPLGYATAGDAARAEPGELLSQGDQAQREQPSLVVADSSRAEAESQREHLANVTTSTSEEGHHAENAALIKAEEMVVVAEAVGEWGAQSALGGGAHGGEGKAHETDARTPPQNAARGAEDAARLACEADGEATAEERGDGGRVEGEKSSGEESVGEGEKAEPQGGAGESGETDGVRGEEEAEAGLGVGVGVGVGVVVGVEERVVEWNGERQGKKVQWPDDRGLTLADVREFEPSESSCEDEASDDRGPSHGCSCAIL
ncbi:unnamed protein product [Closterium sp. Yama58-4]|nr:unnamed protein product [Closterium sp. Yama58-4]